MPLRRTTSLLLGLAATLAAAPAGAQGFRYAEGSGSYRVSSTTTATQEAMGQKAEAQITGSQRLTVGLRKQGKDTMGLTVRIDSIAVQHSLMGAVDVTKLVGKTVAASLTPDGRVLDIRPDSSFDAATADQVVRLVPHVGAALKVGTTWTDTVSGRLNQSGLALDRQTITTHTVVGDTTVGGQKGWRIARKAATKITGSGTAQGQALSVEGTSAGAGTYVVSGGGVFLGAQLTDEQVNKVTIAATGMEISSTIKSAATVERVR